MEIEKSALYQKEASRLAVITEASKLRAETEPDCPREDEESRPRRAQENNPPPMSAKHISQAVRFFPKEGHPLSPSSRGNMMPVTPSAGGKPAMGKKVIRTKAQIAQTKSRPAIRVELQHGRVNGKETVVGTERGTIEAVRRAITPTRGKLK